MPSFVRCRFTLGFHQTSVKPWSVNSRPFMNGSGDRFARARPRLSSQPRQRLSLTCGENAKLVALRIGEDHPAHLVVILADINAPSAERLKARRLMAKRYKGEDTFRARIQVKGTSVSSSFCVATAVFSMSNPASRTSWRVASAP